MATVLTSFMTKNALLSASEKINLEVLSDYFSWFDALDTNWVVKSGDSKQLVLENDDGDTNSIYGDFSKAPYTITSMDVLAEGGTLGFGFVGSLKVSADAEFSGYATAIRITEGANSVSLKGKIYPFGGASTSSVSYIKVSTSNWSFEIKGSVKGNFDGIFSEATVTSLSITVDGKTFAISGLSVDVLAHIKDEDAGTSDQFLRDILAGADSVNGTSGDDWLIGYQGNDTLDGGLGADTADYSDKTAAVRVMLNRSTDTKVYVNGAAEDTIKNIENLVGGSGADVLTGDAANNVLDGGADRVADIIDGGAGTDTISFDSIIGTTGVALSLGVYNATTKTTAQTVARIGSTLTDKVKNVENITGSRNADVLTGNAGDNVITGELGLDTLTGGLGTDSLYGGADRVKDIFDFNAIADSKMGTARDKVYNFVTKIDKIDLSGIDANTANAKLGDQAFVFNNTSAKANSIWYKEAEVDGKRSTKDIVIYGDVDGNTTADFEIGLVGVTAIAAGDLVH
jgi:Ca2+-binding RTX toxin-like protein